jgi:hypothetical protein
MFDAPLPTLGQRFHLIAPDYPGFGQSDAPDSKTFAYTFDHLAAVTVAGAKAYADDIPTAEVHLLDAGHFALDQKSPEIIALSEKFMAAKVAK